MIFSGYAMEGECDLRDITEIRFKTYVRDVRCKGQAV